MTSARLACSVVALIMLSCAFAISSFAQTEDASISGRVSDDTGAVVAAASVRLQSAERGTAQETTTNSSGIYLFPAVRPGVYHVTVRKAGFRQVDYVGLTANVQAHIEQNFRLQIGAVSESVTVTATSINLNTIDGSVSTVVDRQFVENIPLNGRSFQSLLLLTPGVVAVPGASVGNEGEFSVNGMRTDANYYTVDGVSANVGQYNVWQVGAIPMETSLGTTHSLVGVDALQEFRANTSTYSAEFGRSPGAQFSFESRSGTNNWHGLAFEYLRNEALDVNNWFNNHAALPKTAERLNDFGGTLGGPVEIPGFYDGKEKTFFFFSYEGMRLLSPQPAISLPVPSLSLRQQAPTAFQPLLNAFPVPNGQDMGDGSAQFTTSYSNPSSLDSYSIRLDHYLGNKLRIFGRYADTPSNASTRSVADPALITNNTLSTRLATIGATSTFSPTLASEFRFNYTKNDSAYHYLQDSFGGAGPLTLATAMPEISVPKYSYFGLNLLFGSSGDMGYTIGRYGIPSHQWNITESVTSVLGRHTLSFGVDYRRQSAVEGGLQYGQFFNFSNASDVLANQASVFVLTNGEKPLEGYFTNFSAFAQDSWKITDRLNLSLGLRWDLNPPPSTNKPIPALNSGDLSTASFAPLGTHLYQTDYLGFAPRIGIAYRMHRTPSYETVLRGGFGLFYDVGNDNALFGFFIGYTSYASHSGASFPLTSAQAQLLPPQPLMAPYPNSSSLAAPDPHLRLPYALHWNVALEQQLGSHQTLTLSYVASDGRRLLQSLQQLVPTSNPNFQPGSYFNLVANRSSSNYNALQVQFQRHLAHGLQALASYTWSHALDNLSSNGNYSSGIGTSQGLRRGNADFDVRHNFSAALTYDIPGSYAPGFAAAVLKHWSVDLRQTARSALPITNIFSGFTNLPDGQAVTQWPDFVPGAPIYLNDPTAPGGRIINAAAFAAPASGGQGDMPRNMVRGFAAWQTDFAVHRDFPLRDRLKLQFRTELFNVFNHPSFDFDSNATYLGSPATFGRADTTLNNSLGGLNSLFQMGGPRSIQFGLRLSF